MEMHGQSELDWVSFQGSRGQDGGDGGMCSCMVGLCVCKWYLNGGHWVWGWVCWGEGWGVFGVWVGGWVSLDV